MWPDVEADHCCQVSRQSIHCTYLVHEMELQREILPMQYGTNMYNALSWTAVEPGRWEGLQVSQKPVSNWSNVNLFDGFRAEMQCYQKPSGITTTWLYVGTTFLSFYSSFSVTLASPGRPSWLISSPFLSFPQSLSFDQSGHFCPGDSSRTPAK